MGLKIIGEIEMKSDLLELFEKYIEGAPFVSTQERLDLEDKIRITIKNLQKTLNKYNDLLFMVEDKHPGETRDETLKRIVKFGCIPVSTNKNDEILDIEYLKSNLELGKALKTLQQFCVEYGVKVEIRF
jgi:hypothetical protein